MQARFPLTTNAPVLLLSKIVLGIFLLRQGKAVRGNTAKLPEAAGERSGTISNSTTGELLAGLPYRLLIIGDSAAAGVGAGQQTQALAYQTASLLSDTIKRPVFWRLIAKSGLNTLECLQLVQTELLEKHKEKNNDISKDKSENISKSSQYDAIFTSLGANDVTSQIKPTQHIQNLSALWSELQVQTGAQTLLISAIPPMHNFPALPQPLRWYIGRYAGWLDNAVQGWITTYNKNITSNNEVLYCDLSWGKNNSLADMASDGYHPGPPIYALWAAQAASILAQTVNKS